MLKKNLLFSIFLITLCLNSKCIKIGMMYKNVFKFYSDKHSLFKLVSVASYKFDILE